MFEYLFSCLGVVALFSIVLNALQTLYLWFGKATVDLSTGGQDLTKRRTEWACITGASDGIGRDLALGLAEIDPGTHLLLVGRSSDKLHAVKREIENRKGFRGSIKVIVHDYVEGTAEQQVESLEAAFQDKTIAILINNVGQSYPHPLHWNDVPTALFERLVKVNLLSVMVTTKAVLKRMQSCASKKIIVNLGSASVPAAEPMHSVYVATKQGVRAFSQSLQAECPDIAVHCVEPAFVATKMTKIYQAQKVFGMVPSSECANYILKAMQKGRRPGCVYYSPHPIHAMQLWLINWIPLHFWLRMRYRMRQASAATGLSNWA